MRRLWLYYKGLIAEYICIIRLKLTGHTIIGKRIKTPLGEIDLLTQRNGVFHVIEVKYRASGLDDAKIALVESQKRVYNAYKFLSKEGPVRFMYFIMSGFQYELGEMDYLL